MNERSGYSGAHLMLAFIAGGLAGAAVALLTAPQSGTETRASLRGWTRDVKGKAVRVPDALRAAFTEASSAARQAFSESLARAGGEGPEH